MLSVVTPEGQQFGCSFPLFSEAIGDGIRGADLHGINIFRFIDSQMIGSLVVPQAITPGEMTNVKRQLKAREDGDWKRIEWSLVAEPSLKELEVVHGRLLAMDPKVCSAIMPEVVKMNKNK